MSTDYSAMLMSIASNPEKHQVNRAEKMERTVDKMVGNMNKKQDMIDNSKSVKRNATVATGVDYGYGNKTGRTTGD